MKAPAFAALLALTANFVFAQPAPMMRPDNLPELDYRPVADMFNLPANANFGSTSAVAVNSKGNIIVLNRGPQPLMEFDASGKFIRAFGEGLFERPHGLRIDADLGAIHVHPVTCSLGVPTRHLDLQFIAKAPAEAEQSAHGTALVDAGGRAADPLQQLLKFVQRRHAVKSFHR